MYRYAFCMYTYSHSTGTLLVADDSAVIRKIICKYLDALSAEYVVCCDGREAADWYEKNYGACCGRGRYSVNNTFTCVQVDLMQELSRIWRCPGWEAMRSLHMPRPSVQRSHVSSCRVSHWPTCLRGRDGEYYVGEVILDSRCNTFNGYRAVVKPLAIEQVVSMLEEINAYQQELKTSSNDIIEKKMI